jgi:hypothetical protein
MLMWLRCSCDAHDHVRFCDTFTIISYFTNFDNVCDVLGSSSSAREDDLRVTDLLNEFQSLEEHEVKSFFSTLVNNQVRVRVKLLDLLSAIKYKWRPTSFLIQLFKVHSKNLSLYFLQDIQGCLFRVISRERSLESSEARDTETETLKGICTMLLAFYRNLVSQVLISKGNYFWTFPCV